MDSQYVDADCTFLRQHVAGVPVCGLYVLMVSEQHVSLQNELVICDISCKLLRMADITCETKLILVDDLDTTVVSLILAK